MGEAFAWQGGWRQTLECCASLKLEVVDPLQYNTRELWFTFNKVYHTSKLGSQQIFYWWSSRHLHSVHTREGWWSLRFGWYVLEVYDSLKEFGERGVNHLLFSTQHIFNSTRLHSAKLWAWSSVLMRPPWVSLFLYKLVSSPLFSIKRWNLCL